MPIASLDYEGAKLAMEANTPIEQAYRVKAVAKEPWTASFIESLPAGSIFWDLGANVGPYSLIAASRGLFVVAVEPAFFNWATLCRNLAMNNFLDQGVQVQAALAQAAGYTYLHYTDTRSGAASHTLGGARKSTYHKQIVPVTTWDTLLASLLASLPLPPGRAHYAKVDIDGGELGLLAGAKTVLGLLAGAIVEMQLATEPQIIAALGEHGLVLAERYDKREGKLIGNVCYGRFVREV